jgi:DNA-binding transcriptional ArsR family regulator
MDGEPDVSVPARALGDSARGLIVSALLGDKQMPAGDLARLAGVAASTTSEHLRVLLGAGLVEVEHRGRNRFYRLANADVARAIEALQAIAPKTAIRSLRQSSIAADLHEGRSCYDHLAGDLGLRVSDLLADAGIVPLLKVGEVFEAPHPFPTDRFAQALGIHEPEGRRPWVRGCLDWSGRRVHLGGQLGAQVLRAFERNAWIVRRPSSRAVRLTEAGHRMLSDLEAHYSPPSTAQRS